MVSVLVRWPFLLHLTDRQLLVQLHGIYKGLQRKRSSPRASRIADRLLRSLHPQRRFNIVYILECQRQVLERLQLITAPATGATDRLCTNVSFEGLSNARGIVFPDATSQFEGT